MAVGKVAAPKPASIPGVCNLCNDPTHYAHTRPQLPELINSNPDYVNAILDNERRQHQNNLGRSPWQSNLAFSWRSQPQGQSSYNPLPYQQNQRFIESYSIKGDYCDFTLSSVSSSNNIVFRLILMRSRTSKRLADRKVEKFQKNAAKRGAVPKTTTKKGTDYPIGPILLGFFVFVVIGSFTLYNWIYIIPSATNLSIQCTIYNCYMRALVNLEINSSQQQSADGELFTKKREAEGLMTLAEAQGDYVRTLLDAVLGGNYAALKDNMMINGGMFQELANINVRAV
ncbi:hypothetical protein GIB67_033085 [Kingdonia uniflora]|uniref:Uncharacterized protein n=1 Tax=Kingdonia uniflora TaxID=39325 RepID=A0A7J7MYI7_9MAGN|nr:hypothetical protein GIB67_033085 [Kingdonia uniflora]